MPVSSLSVFPVFAIIAAVLAVGATIAAFIFLLPEAKRPKLNKFLGTVSDILNFKTLFIEKILKALYVFATAFALIFGFLMLFSFLISSIPKYINTYICSLCEFLRFLSCFLTISLFKTNFFCIKICLTIILVCAIGCVIII